MIDTYTRSFYPDDISLQFPEKYDGTALLEGDALKPCEPKPEPRHTEVPRAEVKISPHNEDDAEKEQPQMRPWGAKSPLALLTRSILPQGLFDWIGVEDLLIIALALFLFLSKSGDKECALILIALIFIS